MYDEEDSGGIVEKSLSKEKRDWSVVVKETATAMVCIKLVKRNVLVHFWPLLKAISTSSTSAFTNRSIVWLRRDGRDFENERMKNKSMVGLACLNVESYISHVRRKGTFYCAFDCFKHRLPLQFPDQLFLLGFHCSLVGPF